jgi:hypothetical protein
MEEETKESFGKNCEQNFERLKGKFHTFTLAMTHQ